MKRIATIIALARSCAAFAALETVEIAPGGTWTCDAPGKLAEVRAFSTVASGTVALVGTNAVAVISNETVTVTTTVTRRMKTGATLAATNTLVSATCSGGAYTNAPSGVWLSDGEAVTFSFSTAGAFGRALLVIER